MNIKQPFYGAAILCLALSITLISCDWFSTRNTTTDDALPAITGEWNISAIHDSSAGQKNSIGLLALALLTEDSAALKIAFNADSSFRMYQEAGRAIDSGTYRANLTLNEIQIISDSVVQPFMITLLNDTTLNLVSVSDSIWYSLTRDKP